jgi:hypothetical protein
VYFVVEKNSVISVVNIFTPRKIMNNNPKATHYKNFKVAIYARVYEVNQMSDLSYLTSNFEVMSRHLKIDKVYLETHRDMVVAEEATLLQAKQYLEGRGVKVSGGITITANERNRFETYCYTNPDHRQKLKEVAAFTARLFDEVILDDFFFTNCKCASCIQAKGDKSWTQFRLDLLTEAAQELVIGPARLANPNVTLIIKYPNWYEHFQGLGFNLETGPALFDKLYTGCETRDPKGNQHFQPYHGYEIFRYFEALKPGGNAGGWVDPFGSLVLDRYAEQLWVTLFAKAPEVTLFDFRSIQRPIQASDRAAWQGDGTSFDFDQMIAPSLLPDGTWPADTTIALAAGYAFEQADRFLGKLGAPISVKSYKPVHSTGEDFLHNYLGMLGIPIDLVAEFPTEAPTILLTESASHDPILVERIQRQLMDGKTVVITSGLLRLLLGKGIEDIVELQMPDRKALVQEFLIGWFNIYKMAEPMLIPQIQYLTNDSWEEISALGGFTGYPLLHSAQYARGTLYVLTIPDNFSDLYRLPPEVLTRIKATLLQDLYVRVESPSQVALFAYDNDMFIVESFLPESVEVRIVMDSRVGGLRDVLSGEELVGEEMKDWRGQSTGKMGYRTTIKPHSFRVFAGD